jgi:PAS domain S-box-containing protein
MNKRILFLVIIVTVLFAGKTFIDISSDRKQTIAAAERQSKGIVNALSEHAVRTLNDAESTVGALIQEIQSVGGGSVLDEKTLHRILGRHKINSSFIPNLFVAAADGRLLSISSEYPVRYLNVRDREYFRHHLGAADNELFVSRPFRSRVSDRWLISLSKRLNNPDGCLAMIIGVTVDPMYFSGFYSTLELGNNDRVLLVRRDGAVLTQEPFSEKSLKSSFATARILTGEQPGAPRTGTYHLAEANVDKSGINHVEELSIDKVERIVSFRSSADYPVISIVSLHKGDLLGQWRQRAAKSSGGALLLVVLVAILGRLIYRQVRELKHSEDMYSLIVTTANEGIWLQDRENIITYVNPAVADLFGYDSQEMIGQPITAFMCADELPDRATRTQLRRQGLSERYERRFLHKDGSQIWTVVSAAALIDDKEGYQGVVAMCTDISDRKRIEEQQARTAEQLRLAHKMEAVGILAGGMAHDFNNLLQSILGYIFLAKMSVEPGSDVHEHLDAAEDVSGQACELGQRLLILSRGGMTIMRAAPLTPLIMTVVVEALKDTPVTGEYNLPENLPLVTVDVSQIQQAFSHLAANAIEAMPEKGTLRISGRTLTVSDQHELALEPGDYVHISFSDSGTGIPAVNLPRIFDPYFTTKELWSQKGLGLGLALCHTIIRKHNGVITAESHPGQGATFHIYLPLAIEEAP